jgi:ABC-type lipoprotein release transport system permease subunit
VHLPKIAWRNVWRNRRRTLVTIAAMSFGLFVMIVYAGMMEGYLRGMERGILDLEVGDVQIFAGDYRENPSLYTRIDEPEAVLDSLASGGFTASARVLAFGLAAAGESSAGVSFRGVDVAREAAVTSVGDEVAQGRWLDPDDPKGVVLGRRLARILGVGPGEEIVVLSQGGDGAMAYDLFVVRGVLRGIADGTDRSGVYLNEAALRELLGVPDGVHQIIVRRPRDLELDRAAGRIEDLARGLDVKTWRQLLPTLASLLESSRGVMVLMHFIMYVAIGMLVLNAMLMAVFERIRELGVLKALGVGPLEVLRLILLESAIQVLIAVAVGTALALPAVFYLEAAGLNLQSIAGLSVLGIAADPVWRAAVTLDTFTTPVGILLVVVGCAVLYPALKAASVQPVEAMRHH